MNTEDVMSDDEQVPAAGPHTKQWNDQGIGMIRVSEAIGQIALSAIGPARAQHFYGGRLGLRHLFDAGMMSFFQCR